MGWHRVQPKTPPESWKAHITSKDSLLTVPSIQKGPEFLGNPQLQRGAGKDVTPAGNGTQEIRTLSPDQPSEGRHRP